ncbi:MAG: hypothetical protein ACOYOT_09685 [Bacteroidales bacterium]
MLVLLIRLYRWIRFRHGHGVHSPFAFAFINDVVEEKSIFYAYKEIADKLILRRRVGQKFPNLNLKNNLLFYRISQFYDVKRVVIIGCETESTVLYFHRCSKITNCIYFDADSKKIDSVISLSEGERNIKVVEVPFENIITSFQTEIEAVGEPEIIYLHQSIPIDIKQKVLDACSNFRNEQTIVVLDSITSSVQKSFWLCSIRSKTVNVSFDLVKMGVLVYNLKLQKQNYKLYF